MPISNSTLAGNSGTAGGTTAGVVQQSRLNDIPAEDIESMTILKGAAAAAIWGSGAANGAVIIKTKRGSAGAKKLDISFSTSLSVDEVNREHAKQSSYGQGRGGAWNSNASGLSWGDRISGRPGGTDEVDTTKSYFVGGISGKKHYPITTKIPEMFTMTKIVIKFFERGLHKTTTLESIIQVAMKVIRT